MSHREVMQQALEALEGWEHCDKWVWPVTALEQAKRNTTESLAALRTALEQQAEPVAWDKPSASFNDWWDGDYDDSANPFEQDSAAYWAWAGWEAAQRPWVGLTDKDFLEACQIAERGNYLLALQRIQTKLKERNND